MKAKIYHNPRCSKSRATLELLQSKGLDIEIVDYLKNPPGREDVEKLLELLGMSAAGLVRRGEAAFRDSGLTADASDDELIALMAREPVVIERPIVVIGSAARIGRPPERVLELID